MPQAPADLRKSVGKLDVTSNQHNIKTQFARIRNALTDGSALNT